jgi:hypothetical protein
MRLVDLELNTIRKYGHHSSCFKFQHFKGNTFFRATRECTCGTNGEIPEAILVQGQAFKVHENKKG